MTALIALVRKQLSESRWLLGISALALFGLSWLFVYASNRIEREDRRRSDSEFYMRRGGIARAIGGASADNSSTSLEIAWWRHPFVILIVAMWPIARGSASVAGELEKGSLDMVLSRPISRNAFLTSQILSACVGMAVLSFALVAGNQVANRFNFIQSPPGLMAALRPGLNAMALAFSMFGFTLALSSFDIVRWRPNLLGSAITLAMFIALIVSGIPSLDEWKWLENFSIFKAYDPVDAALGASRLGSNTAVLGGIGMTCLLIGYIAFNRRDLPSSS